MVSTTTGTTPRRSAATLAAVRQRYPGRRVWAVYEPLTFHRTAAMLDAFAEVLATADRAVIADIWAGRDPDTHDHQRAGPGRRDRRHGASGCAGDRPGLARGHRRPARRRVRPGDVVLVMGGGRSYVIAERLIELLEAPRR